MRTLGANAPIGKTPLLACGKSRFGGCRSVVTGASLEAIGRPIGCSVVAPGAVINLSKNFFISLLNPKQQATNDKRGAVRYAVNEIVSPSYPSYRSNHWIDFGSMDGRFVSDVYFLRLVPLPFAFEFAPSGAPFTGLLRGALARPLGTTVGARGRGSLKQSLTSFFRRSTQLVTGGSWTGNRFKQLQRYKNKSCTSSGPNSTRKLGG